MKKTIQMSTRQQIESLGFEISRRGKNYFAFGQMSGGLLFDATNHIGLLKEIEAYFKGLMQVDDVNVADVERNEFGDEFVSSCNRCGNDFSSAKLNDEGNCKKCSK